MPEPTGVATTLYLKRLLQSPRDYSRRRTRVSVLVHRTSKFRRGVPEDQSQQGIEWKRFGKVGEWVELVESVLIDADGGDDDCRHWAAVALQLAQDIPTGLVG